jgi:uncharacterized membrane protein
MAVLILGLVLFFGIHVLPWQAGLRESLIQRAGVKGYRGLFSVLALIGLVLIIIGKAQADYQHLWAPPSWGRTAALPLMFAALLLVPAANFPNNIKRLVRHPMLIGIALWSCAHLLANGDLASVILFASFGVYSLLAIVSANRRGKNSNLPKTAIKQDVLALVIGVLAFSILLFAHPYLFGVAIL